MATVEHEREAAPVVEMISTTVKINGPDPAAVSDARAAVRRRL